MAIATELPHLTRTPASHANCSASPRSSPSSTSRLSGRAAPERERNVLMGRLTFRGGEEDKFTPRVNGGSGSR